jgi:hypothetical protein
LRFVRPACLENDLIYQPVGLLIDHRQTWKARPPHSGERQWIASNSKQAFGAMAIAL